MTNLVDIIFWREKISEASSFSYAPSLYGKWIYNKWKYLAREQNSFLFTIKPVGRNTLWPSELLPLFNSMRRQFFSACRCKAVSSNMPNWLRKILEKAVKDNQILYLSYNLHVKAISFQLSTCDNNYPFQCLCS